MIIVFIFLLNFSYVIFHIIQMSPQLANLINGIINHITEFIFWGLTQKPEVEEVHFAVIYSSTQ